ncbi:MAG: DUF1028 domain-containing protein [Chloroflexi bacterium]|nr:DUF1028 domain-containing protein [Chloroflexota bacterium]
MIVSIPAENPIYRNTLLDRSTFSIVAIDPQTGDVGAAGASCVPISASSLAALVPGQGAAAIQAAFTPQNQSQVLELLSQGTAASEIIELVSDEDYDQQTSIRQYGVVTLKGGEIQARGFTGSENNDWAGDRQDENYAVSAQGNTLEGKAVISDALSAFISQELGPLHLSDRLLRALEAASAAGGDLRCNQADFEQTAQAAFIAVSQAGQPAFSATVGSDPSSKDPALPWLFISIIEPKGGPNPLIELRRQYDTWRLQNLPPCENCNLDSIAVPPGGEQRPLSKAMLNFVNRIGLTVAIAFICTTGIVFILSLLVFIRRRIKNPKTE